MADGPTFRIWPPVALGLPLLVGVQITAAAGDPFTMQSVGVRAVGVFLIAAFAAWNGTALWLMARRWL